MQDNKENKTEKRYYNLPVQIEKRADGSESRKIVGYAAKFNTWSHNFGSWFREKIAPGAFDDVLDQDVVALFNHDKNFILARNKKTLKLSVDDTGLRYEFEAPNTTAGNDLLESIKRGDITGSSFQFTVKETKWAKSDDPDIEEERTILKLKQLIDVSPVTFPAYPDASVDVAKRDHDAFYERQTPKKEVPFERELLKENINILKKKISN